MEAGHHSVHLFVEWVGSNLKDHLIPTPLPQAWTGQHTIHGFPQMSKAPKHLLNLQTTAKTGGHMFS